MWLKLKDGSLLNLDNVVHFYIVRNTDIRNERQFVWRPMAKTLSRHNADVELAGTFETLAEAQAIIDKIDCSIAVLTASSSVL